MGDGYITSWYYHQQKKSKQGLILAGLVMTLRFTNFRLWSQNSPREMMACYLLFSFHKGAVHKNGWRLRGFSWSDCYIHVKSHKKEILGEVIPNCPLCLTPTKPSDLSRQPVPCAKDTTKSLNHFNTQEINPKSSINHKRSEMFTNKPQDSDQSTL